MQAAVMENVVLTAPMPHEKTFDPGKLEVRGAITSKFRAYQWSLERICSLDLVEEGIDVVVFDGSVWCDRDSEADLSLVGAKHE